MEEISTKICSECDIEKPLTDFTEQTRGLFGVKSKCKKCVVEKWSKPYYERTKNYSKSKRKKIKAYQKDYQKINRNKISDQVKVYYEANRERILIQKATYYKNNKNKIQPQKNLYKKRKRRTNPKYKLNINISRVINASLHGNKAGRHWELLVGYTLENLRKYLEKQFTEGMTWDNYGSWHLDHKIPISVFNFTKSEHRDFKRCWALKNLQPLWEKDNLEKRDKLTKPFQPSLLM